jgi:hypothetical protein
MQKTCSSAQSGRAHPEFRRVPIVERSMMYLKLLSRALVATTAIAFGGSAFAQLGGLPNQVNSLQQQIFGLRQQITALQQQIALPSRPLIVLTRGTSADAEPDPLVEGPWVRLLVSKIPTAENRYAWNVFKGRPCPTDYTPIAVAVTALSPDRVRELPAHPNDLGGIPFNRTSNVGSPGFRQPRQGPLQDYNWIFASGYTDEPAYVVAVVTCALADRVQYEYQGSTH